MYRKTRAKRKLIPSKVLSRIDLAVDFGVPLARAVRDNDLEISRTAAASLLRYYRKYLKQDVAPAEVANSLFPPWLDDASEKEQVNPDGWVYVGRFPWGYWQNENN